MADSSYEKIPSFSSASKALKADAISPALMVDFLISDECNFSSEEKSAAYKRILKASILAFDAKTGTSHFSWAYNCLSALDQRVKQAALLHTDVTLASICKAFFAYLQDAEETEDMAATVFGSLAAVGWSFIESSLNQYCERIATERSKEAKGVTPATSKKASKTEVEKFQQQLAQKDAEISKKKQELESKRKEVQDLQAKMLERKRVIESLKSQKNEAETKAALTAAKYTAADNEAEELRAKWSAAVEDVKAQRRETDAANEKFENMYKLVTTINEKNDLLFNVAVGQARMSEDGVTLLSEQITGVRQTVTEQATKIVQLETKLKQAEEDLESEKKDGQIVRECLAGVSYHILFRRC